jgi:ADP-heptose:LPS heptosyltransferase
MAGGVPFGGRVAGVRAGIAGWFRACALAPWSRRKLSTAVTEAPAATSACARLLSSNRRAAMGYSQEMLSRVLLVKLAAIGDVALAARALREFEERYDACAEYHWVIDSALAPLARAIAGPRPRIEFHPIDASRLFTGGKRQKSVEALRLARASLSTRAQHTLLLHRDLRYRLLLRPTCRGPLITIGRRPVAELAVYREAFERLAGLLHAPERDQNEGAGSATPPARSGRIGVLVGGGRSQKVDFAEKRWPRVAQLVRALHDRGDVKVVLFGGPDDVAAERSVLQGLDPARVESLVGKQPLGRLPELLAGLDAFVSIDSGLAQVAAAVMTAPHQRVVALFGPTNPRVWAPTASGQARVELVYKALSCSPCYADDGDFKPCRFAGPDFQRCMTEISVEEVLRLLA